jgi:hypothetical protein
VPDDITAVLSTIGHATDAFTQLARPGLNAEADLRKEDLLRGAACDGLFDDVAYIT